MTVCTAVECAVSAAPPLNAACISAIVSKYAPLIPFITTLQNVQHVQNVRMHKKTTGHACDLCMVHHKHVPANWYAAAWRRVPNAFIREVGALKTGQEYIEVCTCMSV